MPDVSLRRRLALMYLPLVIASGVVRATRHNPEPGPGVHIAAVREVNGDALGASPVRLAYRDSAPRSPAIPVVLIHGSPGTGEVFQKLTAILSPRFRVIAPDLPGFGDSTRGIPDYSFRAHARYVVQLLDALGVRKAHFAAFSMGGGVVLSIADLAPERVASIAMISAIGVQERELLGSYTLNHALHGAQLAALWTLGWAVPHFGRLDEIPFNVEYARNFFDSDQRPLRGMLERYRGPMLILHGSRDPMVPVAAAREHHHIVRQSQIEIFDGNHFMVFQRPEVLAPSLERFWEGLTPPAPKSNPFPDPSAASAPPRPSPAE